jgi:hypothetical protein
MAQTRRHRKSGTRKAGKGTPWTAFVKKVYMEMKKKDKNAKLGAAMKEASRRKREMK